ncbi:MAG: hypothetical protein J7601_12760 [Chloroflexi bacterium]|jgi:tRNA nucleotidyltransferase (CCA-adding enzyme)|nr:hypothetical protein [Chloroflexota bacterium]
MLEALAHAFAAAGGRAFLVGGGARDLVFSGDPPKDFDIEVFGLSPDAVLGILSGFGPVSAVGASFGVFKLRTPNGEIDVSLPRRENKAGRGHKGFIVTPDPTMTPEQAAARRDFTVNAVMLDPLTGEVLDFYGGRGDWEARTLRHVGPAFAEDPLRVLRGMQFAARWGFTLAAETAFLCQTLVSEFSALPKERVWGEWEKWATRSRVPSAGLAALAAAGWLEALAVPQPVDAGRLDALAAAPLAQARTALLLASLCADATPVAAREFLARIGAPGRVIGRVMALREALERWADPARRCESGARRLAHLLGQEGLALGDLAHLLGDEARAALLTLGARAGVLERPPVPLLSGKHLLALGWSPGPKMGHALRAAFEAQLDGAFSDVEGALAWVARWCR